MFPPTITRSADMERQLHHDFTPFRFHQYTVCASGALHLLDSMQFEIRLASHLYTHVLLPLGTRCQPVPLCRPFLYAVDDEHALRAELLCILPPRHVRIRLFEKEPAFKDVVLGSRVRTSPYIQIRATSYIMISPRKGNSAFLTFSLDAQTPIRNAPAPA